MASERTEQVRGTSAGEPLKISLDEEKNMSSFRKTFSVHFFFFFREKGRARERERDNSSLFPNQLNGLARVHGGGSNSDFRSGRPHGALCAENDVLASSDADRRGFVAKLAVFSSPAFSTIFSRLFLSVFARIKIKLLSLSPKTHLFPAPRLTRSLSKTVSLALLALMMCSTTSAEVRPSALMSLIWLVLVFQSRFVAATRIVEVASSSSLSLSPFLPLSLSLPLSPYHSLASSR